MNTRNFKRIDRLAELGVFTASEAKLSLSISQPTIYRLEKEGLIDKVARGLFLHPLSDVEYEHLDFIISNKIFGKDSVIGGLSALSFYNLIEQAPLNVWVLTEPCKTKSSSQKKYRLLRTTTSLKTEVVKMNQFNIVSLERALVEGLKYESKLGEGLVFKSIKTALQSGQTTESKLAKAAKKLKIMSSLEKKWELIVA